MDSNEDGGVVTGSWGPLAAVRGFDDLGQQSWSWTLPDSLFMWVDIQPGAGNAYVGATYLDGGPPFAYAEYEFGPDGTMLARGPQGCAHCFMFSDSNREGDRAVVSVDQVRGYDVLNYFPQGASSATWSVDTLQVPLYVREVAIDENGGVVVAGESLQPFSIAGEAFAPGTTQVPVILKFDRNGRFLWGHDLSGARGLCFGLAIREDGSVLVSGTFWGATRWGTGSLSSTDPYVSGFVVAADALGMPMWARALDGTHSAMRLASSPLGDFALVGGNTPCRGMLVDRLDHEGNLKWERAFDASPCDTGEGLMIAPNAAAFAGQNLAITGTFWGYVDFGTGAVVSQGATDGFLIVLGP